MIHQYIYGGIWGNRQFVEQETKEAANNLAFSISTVARVSRPVKFVRKKVMRTSDRDNFYGLAVIRSPSKLMLRGPQLGGICRPGRVCSPPEKV